jgi:hypothetical protein
MEGYLSGAFEEFSSILAQPQTTCAALTKMAITPSLEI